MIVKNLLVFFLFFLFSSNLYAEKSCEASLSIDHFDYSSANEACDYSSCTSVIEVDVLVKGCENSNGGAEIEVDVDSVMENDENNERINVNWVLVDDTDTEIEEEFYLDEGQWIDEVDIDNIECECS